ncbi:MAG: transposase [Gammaproteobacteria bacterium]
MSLQPRTAFQIPQETQRIVRAAFPQGTLCLRLAETLGPLYADEQFADLFPRRGQPAEAPGRLAWVTVLQFVENLSDRAAADAVRGRLDWKYLLGLALTDPGFHHTVLSEFRSRLVAGQAEQRLLDGLLAQFQEQGLLQAGGRQRTDSTHVLAAVRDLNRLERVGETLRAALNSVAMVAPDWLQTLAPPAWYERYSRRIENYHLPKTDAARQALAATIGADGKRLLKAIDAATEHGWLGKIPAVQTLRRVWTEQYIEAEGALVWPLVQDMPSPAELIASPYDPEARYSSKRSMEWVGYKAHLTETCDPARGPCGIRAKSYHKGIAHGPRSQAACFEINQVRHVAGGDPQSRRVATHRAAVQKLRSGPCGGHCGELVDRHAFRGLSPQRGHQRDC